jgi:hypothetical protein
LLTGIHTEDERFPKSMNKIFVYISVNKIVYEYRIILHSWLNESVNLEIINSVFKPYIIATLTLVRFEDFIVGILKGTIFWDVCP